MKDIETIIAVLSTLPNGVSMEDLKKAFIITRLRHNRGNRTHTIRDLKISIRSLRGKMNMYRQEGYEIPEYQDRRIVNDNKI